MASKIEKNNLDAKSRILNTAMRLFNKQGVHHTGTEQLIAESDVAKMTFYKHFPTKSKLVCEFFKLKDQIWFDTLNSYIDQADGAENKILSLFDALEGWFSEPDYYGCPFVRGLSDFDASNDPEIAACVNKHFSETTKLVSRLLTEMKVKSEEVNELTTKILTLITGAIVLAHATNSPAAALVNKKVAKELLNAAIGKNG